MCWFQLSVLAVSGKRASHRPRAAVAAGRSPCAPPGYEPGGPASCGFCNTSAIHRNSPGAGVNRCGRLNRAVVVSLEPPSRYHVDTLDVYSAKQRQAFVKQAAVELGCLDDIVKRDLGRVLLKLEGLQDVAIQEALAPKDAATALDAMQERDALALLRDPMLTDRIVADMGRCGVVGEAANLLAGYLAAVSRKLDHPLHPGDAGACGHLDHADLYAGQHPAVEGHPHGDTSGAVDAAGAARRRPPAR